eukprot:CAMPEP_0185754750 /NCGR_PEP_ID=MMETSP1174-20130828/13348_1 /TAXON_ID=35687 /ORGANISM="Dictyocha speculum, Strain CCMP1381" /LENGTH=1366 /DNA_ID=CAMNT_0028433085 /DNA_START=108 /DNA_END=4208 /DNA_ORIENTATION=+
MDENTTNGNSLYHMIFGVPPQKLCCFESMNHAYFNPIELLAVVTIVHAGVLVVPKIGIMIWTILIRLHVVPDHSDRLEHKGDYQISEEGSNDTEAYVIEGQKNRGPRQQPMATNDDPTSKIKHPYKLSKRNVNRVPPSTPSSHASSYSASSAPRRALSEASYPQMPNYTSYSNNHNQPSGRLPMSSDTPSKTSPRRRPSTSTSNIESTLSQFNLSDASNEKLLAQAMMRELASAVKLIFVAAYACFACFAWYNYRVFVGPDSLEETGLTMSVFYASLALHKPFFLAIFMVLQAMSESVYSSYLDSSLLPIDRLGIDISSILNFGVSRAIFFVTSVSCLLWMFWVLWLSGREITWLLLGHLPFVVVFIGIPIMLVLPFNIAARKFLYSRDEKGYLQSIHFDTLVSIKAFVAIFIVVPPMMLQFYGSSGSLKGYTGFQDIPFMFEDELERFLRFIPWLFGSGTPVENVEVNDNPDISHCLSQTVLAVTCVVSVLEVAVLRLLRRFTTLEPFHNDQVSSSSIFQRIGSIIQGFHSLSMSIVCKKQESPIFVDSGTWLSCYGMFGKRKGSPTRITVTGDEITGEFNELNLEIKKHWDEASFIDMQSTRVYGDIRCLGVCKRLEEVNFNSTLVKGNIRVFGEIPQVKVIRMSNSMVEGDIDPLGKCLALREVELLNSKVSGNVDVFENCPELQKVGLWDTEVTGNINAFKFTPKLRKLSLMKTCVHGNVETFKSCPQLCVLIIQSSNEIHGDISAFQYNKKLEKLGVFRSNIQGNIEVFKSAFKLIRLSLTECQLIFGDLNVLSCHQKLETIDLSDTQIVGSLQDLRSCIALRVLKLKNTKVTGALVAFEALQHVIEIHLDNTNICGDIFSLSCCKNAEVLSLSNTSVTGDVSRLTGFDKLEYVDMSFTQLSGNINATETNMHLRVLILENTHVMGDINAIVRLENLHELNLSGTQVTGDIILFRDLQYLEVVILSRTLIFGDISVFKMTPRLRKLNLYGCSAVTGDLSVFANTPQLQLLDLYKCPEITGSIDIVTYLSRLSSLSLDSAKVFGNVPSLIHKTKLREVRFGRMNLTGNLSIFQNLTRLNVLVILSDRKVNGSIKVFSRCQSLHEIELSGSRITGNLVDFAYHFKIKMLTLYRTSVAGDLSSLCKLKSLQKIDLRFSPVAGSIEALRASRRLENIMLADCPNITGDISCLIKFKDLVDVVLGGCVQIKGNVSVFESTPLVQKLDLCGTHVSGSISVFGSLDHIRELNLKHTLIKGSFNSLKSCKRLENVSLAHTDIHGDISAFSDANKLEVLSLYGCKKVTGDIGAVRNCVKLQLLSLFGTAVTGDILNLRDCMDLRSLYVRSTALENQADRMKEVLPYCRFL